MTSLSTGVESSARHRRERRSIPPFGDGTDPNGVSNMLDRVLAECRFWPFAHVLPDVQDAHFMTQEESLLPIEPRFRITVEEIDALGSRLGLTVHDLQVGLSVRVPGLRRYQVLENWMADCLPDGPWSPHSMRLQDLQCGRGMDFILTLRVATDRDELSAQGLGQGKALTRRVFSVRESVDTSTFPFRWVEFGGETGYPKEALWVIEWKEPDTEEDDFRQPADQLLTVLANKNAEGALGAMAQAQGVNDLPWRMLAADITTQIWVTVLAKIATPPNEDDTESLAGQTFTRLARAGDLSYYEVKQLAKDDDPWGQVRKLVAKAMRLVR